MIARPTVIVVELPSARDANHCNSPHGCVSRCACAAIRRVASRCGMGSGPVPPPAAERWLETVLVAPVGGTSCRAVHRTAFSTSVRISGISNTRQVVSAGEGNGAAAVRSFGGPCNYSGGGGFLEHECVPGETLGLDVDVGTENRCDLRAAGERDRRIELIEQHEGFQTRTHRVRCA